MFRYCGTGAMINLIKILKDLEAVSFKRTESSSAEQSLDEGSLQSSDEGSDPRIQTLQIIINILDSEQNMGTFLTRSDFFYINIYIYKVVSLFVCLSVWLTDHNSWPQTLIRELGRTTEMFLTWF